MSDINDILRLLNTCFIDASQVGGNMQNLCHAYTRQFHCPLYIYCNDCSTLSPDKLSGLSQMLKQMASQDGNLQSPLVMIYPQNDTYLAGVILYWDFNRLYINEEINWQPLNPDTISWFEMQISARRMHISSIPMDYVGVFKTISLNSDEILDAQVMYWRKITDSYKMVSHESTSDQDRFNRILNGTPEDEFPKDLLDEAILQQIKSAYPNAEIRSKVFLFDTDLLNIRLIKDKRLSRLDMTFCLYNNLTLQPTDTFHFYTECYYHSNFWKNSTPKIFGINNIFNIEMYNSIKNLHKTTYQSISFFNI